MFANFKLVENARAKFHKLHSIQLSVAFGVFTGIASVIGCFGETINPWVLLAVAVVVNVALIPLARLVKQDDCGAAPASPEPPK